MIAKGKAREKMALTQIVRDRFDEITEWRSRGVSWKKIDEELRGSEGGKSPMSVRNLYFKELAQRQSQERNNVLDWIDAHFDQIQELRRRGYDWAAVHTHLSLDEDTDQSLTVLIAEFEAMKTRRTQESPVQASLGEEPAKKDSIEATYTKPSMDVSRPKPENEPRSGFRISTTPKEGASHRSLSAFSRSRDSDNKDAAPSGKGIPDNSGSSTISDTFSKPTQATSSTAHMRLREIALSFLASPSQRQLVDSLAEMQALNDDHPIWGVVAMLGAVISGEGSTHLDLGELKKIVPTKSELEVAKSEMQRLGTEVQALRSEIQGARSDINSLRSQTDTLAAEIRTTHATITTSLSQIANVITGAANLNREMPEFLESLRVALTQRTTTTKTL